MLLENPLCQDTCVALHALSEYAILSYVGGVNLTISLASTNLDFQETFELNRDNKKLLQSAKVTWIHGLVQRFCTQVMKEKEEVVLTHMYHTAGYTHI